MARTRTKYSIFCKTKPAQKSIVFGAVYLSADRMWVLAKGKRYQNGRFRYIYNGREGTVGQFHWVDLEGLSYSAMEEKIREMNWSVLSSMYPRKRKNRNVAVVTTDHIQAITLPDDTTPLTTAVIGTETIIVPNIREWDEWLPVVDVEYEPTGN